MSGMVRLICLKILSNRFLNFTALFFVVGVNTHVVLILIIAFYRFRNKSVSCFAAFSSRLNHRIFVTLSWRKISNYSTWKSTKIRTDHPFIRCWFTDVSLAKGMLGNVEKKIQRFLMRTNFVLHRTIAFFNTLINHIITFVFFLSSAGALVFCWYW